MTYLRAPGCFYLKFLGLEIERAGILCTASFLGLGICGIGFKRIGVLS